MSRNRRLLIAGALVALVVGYLLFRPDTLVTDVRADEPLAEAFATTTATAAVTPTDPNAATTSLSTPTATTVPQVQTVSTGLFAGINHRASGTAAVYQSGDEFVLRFEDDTDIQNGPDLYVWVLADDAYDGGTPSSYLDLGKLTGNVGGQNYDLPAEFDPGVHRTVLIWCLRFAVPFATAALE